MRHYRKRFLDGRSAEARRLKVSLGGLIADLGGEAALTGSQRLILEQLKEKIITVNAIRQHIDKQAALLSEDGELIPSLRRSYLAYTNAVQRDVALLFGLRERPAKKAQDLAGYLNGARWQVLTYRGLTGPGPRVLPRVPRGRVYLPNSLIFSIGSMFPISAGRGGNDGFDL